jgi:hypothetical protein
MKQFMFEQGNPETRKVANDLRKAGYKITTSSLGNQVTSLGLIKTTMINVYNDDFKLSEIINKRDFFSKGI